MIYLTEADREKMNLIDDIFRTIPVDVIRQWSEADKIVEVLKMGNSSKPNGIVAQIVDDNSRMNSQIAQMQADISMLRGSLQTLVRMANRPVHDYQNTSDLNLLKGSLGIY